MQRRLSSFDSNGARHPDLGLRSWALGGVSVPGTPCVDAQQGGSLCLSGSTKLMCSPAPARAKNRLSQSAALDTNHYAACWSLEGLFQQLQLLSGSCSFCWFISEHPVQCNEQVNVT